MYAKSLLQMTYRGEKNIFVGAYFFLSVISLSRAGYATVSRPNIVGETTRTHVEGEFRSYPRAKNITYTRDFRVAGWSTQREPRPASCALLSSPFLLLSLRLIPSLPTTDWEQAMAMAQSRCPLAKLKYLAFGRARIKGCTIRDSLGFASQTRGQIIARSIINAWFGATHARDTRNKFRTTTKQKDCKSLARFNTLYSRSLVFNLLDTRYRVLYALDNF